MAIKDTDRKARANYRAKVKQFNILLYPSEADIIAHLEQLQEPRTTYIKRLIREDMEKTHSK